MRIADFELERFFARYEFAVRHLLCASDLEGLPMAELLAMADPEAEALWRDLRLGYTESLGHPLLRREIAALYDTVDPDEVVVFSGAEEAIFAIANVHLQPGDHAIVVWPAYQSLHEVARASGADVTLHELQAADGWAIDVDAMRRQVTPRTRLIVVNAPHNPTGSLPDAATYRAVAELAADAGAILLSDEVYRFLELDPADRLPAGADVGAARGLDRRDVEVVRAGRPADRVAGVARPRPARRGGAVQGLHDDLRLGARGDPGPDRPPGTGAGAGPVAGDRRGQPRAARRLLRPTGRSISRGSGRAAGRSRSRELLGPTPIDRFAAELLEAEGVLLAPGSIFGHPGNHFRLGFGRTDLPAGLERLEAYAERALPVAEPPLTAGDTGIRWTPGSTSSTRPARTSRRP